MTKFISSNSSAVIDQNDGASASQLASNLIELQDRLVRRFSLLNNSRQEELPLNSSNSLNDVEQAILRSTVPIDLEETETVNWDGLEGILLNKAEICNWVGDRPLEEYPINQDASPEVITKKYDQPLEYVQELAVRYLKPPTPPPPGEIVIVEESGQLNAPAPPLIIRQQPPRPETPEPLVVREAPPIPPEPVPSKIITISGKNLPPPPRKVVIERLAPLPSKPQSVIVERWLPYFQTKRRVILKGKCQQDLVVLKPKNVIVQWEAPEVKIKKEVRHLGVVKANPVEYVRRYGDSLKLSNDLPDFVLDIKTPEGLVLAANHKSNELHELEGDVDALKYVDLDKEGLSGYKPLIETSNELSNESSEAIASSVAPSNPAQELSGSVITQSVGSSAALSGSISTKLLSLPVTSNPLGELSEKIEQVSEQEIDNSVAASNEQNLESYNPISSNSASISSYVPGSTTSVENSAPPLSGSILTQNESEASGQIYGNSVSTTTSRLSNSVPKSNPSPAPSSGPIYSNLMSTSVSGLSASSSISGPVYSNQPSAISGSAGTPHGLIDSSSFPIASNYASTSASSLPSLVGTPISNSARSKYAWSETLTETQDILKRIFDLIETDEDDMVNFEETERIITIIADNLGSNENDETIQSLMLAFDRNKIGSVDLVEFMDTIRIFLQI